jgi:PAS domain S-box-containing protein
LPYTHFQDSADSQQQNAFLANLTRASSQPMAIGYADGRLGFVNRAFEELTGYSVEELRTLGWERITPPEWSEFERQQLAEQLKTGRPIRYEKEYQRKDGSRVPIELLVHLVPDPQGKPAYYFSFLTDITERKCRERELQESEDRVRLATEATGVGIWEWNVITGKIRWDPQMFRIYGIEPTRDGWVDYPTWSTAVLPEDLPRQEQVLQDTVAGLGHSTREFRIRRRSDGEVRHIQAVEAARAGGGRQTQWVVGTNLDITGRTRDEQRLRQLVALAEQRTEELASAKAVADAANKSKDNFLAVLSHELRTPLTPVLAVIGLLETDTGLSVDQRELVQSLRRNVELEARLIDDLLDVTRITRNKLELQWSVLDAHSKIRNVMAICAEDAAAKGVRVQAELGAAHHHIDGDLARFQQIIWNLLKNAIKFTPASGGIFISTANPRPDRLVISVRDTGVGIDDDAIKSIFDAFEQGGRDVTRRFGGLGLGLAISRALVAMHRGTITASSAGRGHGATFTIELPLSTALETPRHPVVPAGNRPLSCSILLVEDHEDTRRMMARLLKGFGCTVETAGSISEALQAAEHQKFNLLISDIGLPDGMGTDLMQQLKLRHGLKGIALSGYGMDEDLAKSTAAGFEVHLIKPVNLQVLEDAVRRIAGVPE